MIPILFPSTEAAFATNGIGRLRCTEAYVEEIRNGEYEMTFTVPITDRHFGNIQEGMYVLATHDNTGKPQPFKIYGRTAPMNGLITFRAHHKSYELSNVIVNPFSATSAPEAIARIRNFCINPCTYEFWTDKTTVANFNLTEPASVRSILGGMQGSFLDAFGGGEYEFDGDTVRLWNSRGADNGVTIRYGKNLVDIEQEIDALGIYNAIVPFWAGEVDEQRVLVLLDERMVVAQGVTNPVPVVMDMSSEFDEQPTQAQLRQKAAKYLADNEPWVPSQNIKVDFVQLWQTEEYKQYAPLQRVGLCDTVTVYYKALGITGKAKVIRTKYNVLLERYDEIELGNPRTSFADTIKKDFDAQMKQTIVSMQGFMDAAIASATDLITGGSGGNVVIGFNAAGKPSEILYMDTDDMTTATNIIRINMNGIGFSTNGGQTYRNAWTIDGHFVADFIDTGTLNANIMRAGIITDAQGLNFWNLDTGDFRMAATTQIGTGGTTVGDLATGDEVTEAVNTGINNYRQEVNAIVADLQDQIDGVIDTYYYDYAPTLTNYPADEWTTEALRKDHEGDLFMDTSTGKSYRFVKQNNVWQWAEIPDTAAAQALQVAQQAQNLANTKRRVFTSTPYTPYDVGDLWVQGSTGDIFKCSTARASGNYTASDWDKASKYTDDTVANQALEAINTMEIGGRNLLHNTNVIKLSPTTSRPNINGDSAASGYLSANSGSLTAATHGARITSNSAVRPGIIFGSNTPSASGTHGLAVGREYTFSCDWETRTLGGSPDATTTYYLRAYLYYAKSTSASSMIMQSFATWHTFKTSDISDRNAVVSGHGAFTFIVPDDAVAWNIRVYSTNINTASLYAAGNYLQIENVKLETGQKATAWTPAPEDIDSDINGINVYLETLQDQVDGKAETWYQADDPSEAWTTAEKTNHRGDLWYRTGDGVTLRYSGSTWQEQDIPKAVFDTLDGKAQVFISQPVPPYDVGDLWVQGASGDILRCTTKRASGSYVAGDWVKASKYTDDSAFNAFRDGTYANFVTQTNQTLNAKVTTFYQADQPTATATGDLWIDTDDGNKLYRYSGSGWVAVQDTAIQSALTAASNAQTTADGKIVTFAQASQPTATDAGDLWIDTNDNNKLHRWSGTSWVTVTDASAVAALEIGGRNLLLDTNAPSLTKVASASDRYWSNASNLAEDGTAEFIEISDPPAKGITHGIRLSDTVTRTSERLHGLAFYKAPVTSRYTFLTGQPYTMSCYVRNVSGSANRFSLGVEGGTNWGVDSHVYFTPTTEWKRYSRTFTPTSEGTNKVVYFQMCYKNIGAMEMCGFKLEKGNKATDWTSAPEDVEAEISALGKDLQSQIDGKIQTWYEADDPAVKYSWSADDKAKHTGDLWYKTTDHTTWRYDGSAWVEQAVADDVFDAIDGKTTIYYGRPTATYEGVQTGDYLVDSTDGSTYRWSGSTWVTVTDYATAINNIEIGGKNKLTGTNSTTALTATGVWEDRTWRKAGGGTGTITYQAITDAPDKTLGNGWQIDVESVGSDTYGQSLAIGQNRVKIIGGQQYTLSCYAKGSGQLYMFSGITNYRGGKHTVTSEWKRYSTTFTAGTTSAYVSDNGANVFFGASVAGTSITICGMQLESGNKASAWNPAPEDFDAKIDTLEAYADSLKTQIDGKAETWYMAEDPAVKYAWTAEQKAEHEGDLWFETGTHKTYRYSGSIWQVQDVPTEVFDAIDGKAQVFVSQPKPPYAIGDIWVQGSNGDILRCATARKTGSYTASDWVKASKYTDDSAVTALNSALTQEEIFNRLTNNGQAQGIYMQNGLLYVNATYIQGGILKLGGNNNINGSIEVYNASGTQIGKWDKDGAFMAGDLELAKTVSSYHYQAGIHESPYLWVYEEGTRYGLEIRKWYNSTPDKVGILAFTVGDEKLKNSHGASARNIIYSNRALVIEAVDPQYESGSSAGRRSEIRLEDGKVEFFNVENKNSAPMCRLWTTINDVGMSLTRTTTSAANMNYGSGGLISQVTSSSRRYKRNIGEITEELNPDKLYDVPVKTFIYRDEYLSKDDHNYGKRIVGFIAEDIDEVYPIACQYDEDNRPEMWNVNVMVPAMLKLIQDQKKQIDDLETRITRLEKLIEKG